MFQLPNCIQTLRDLLQDYLIRQGRAFDMPEHQLLGLICFLAMPYIYSMGPTCADGIYPPVSMARL
jgi:hypothetical protein